MTIVPFEGCNCKLPQLGDAPACLYKEGNLACYIVAFLPSEDDMKSLKAGQPIYVQIYREVPPTMIYTVNKDGQPNI